MFKSGDWVVVKDAKTNFLHNAATLEFVSVAPEPFQVIYTRSSVKGMNNPFRQLYVNGSYQNELFFYEEDVRAATKLDFKRKKLRELFSLSSSEGGVR